MISQRIRDDFPALANNPGLIYLDNAATTLKPKQVIDAQKEYYENFPANVGRGSHRLARKASEKYEDARAAIANLAGAGQNEIVFTRNATESINLAAVSLERMGLFGNGDEVVVSLLEHHANLIPWQEVCRRTGAKLKIVGLKADYTLDMQDLQGKVTKKTKIVALAHASNTVASILPAKEAAKIAHESGALFFMDASQSVPHMEMNVKKIGCDFSAFSGHKMMGPTGIGAFYCRADLLAKMPPYNYGGGMIHKVYSDRAEYAEAPQKFEAGTPAIAEAIGFADAARYLKKIGIENVRAHEKALTGHCLKRLGEIKGMEMHCPMNPEKQAGIILFGSKAVEAVDFAVALDEARHIAVRSGMHCAEPMVSSINPKGLARASFYIYNTTQEIDAFADEAAAILRSFG